MANEAFHLTVCVFNKISFEPSLVFGLGTGQIEQVKFRCKN